MAKCGRRKSIRTKTNKEIEVNKLRKLEWAVKKITNSSHYARKVGMNRGRDIDVK